MTEQQPPQNGAPRTPRNNSPQGASAGSLTRFWLFGAIGAVVLVGAVIAGVVVAGQFSDDEPPEYMGVRIQPPWPKPDFVLQDTAGNDYDIVEETKGYVTLIFMGYTHCPDECPTHMLDISQTLKEMDPEDAEQVKVLFVTTDPERDTPERMRQWLDLFHPEFVGLTADMDTLVAFQRTMGVQAAEQYEAEGIGEEGYGVAHAVFVFAFDRETNLAHLVYPIGIERDEWLNDLTNLVQEGWHES
jgi:protein SCO1